jgi:hypothetical protein
MRGTILTFALVAIGCGSQGPGGGGGGAGGGGTGTGSGGGAAGDMANPGASSGGMPWTTRADQTGIITTSLVVPTTMAPSFYAPCGPTSEHIPLSGSVSAKLPKAGVKRSTSA